MDRTTIDAYNAAARQFAAEWQGQPAPTDMYALLSRWFVPAGRTADIGCGAGRDVGWLNAQGFKAEGFDASPGLLREAVASYPDCVFHEATLPALEGVASSAFDNVLCETVIMHLPPAQVTAACARLVDILRPRGVLYLSWRVAADTASSRDAHGRLYAAFDDASVIEGLRGTDVLQDMDAVNASSGKRVQRLIVRRANN